MVWLYNYLWHYLLLWCLFVVYLFLWLYNYYNYYF